MNSTRWVTLTEFVKHLGRTGVCRVDETEKGWFMAWIDSSPKALAKQEAALKKERSTTSDEQRERMLIAEQIERANAEREMSDSPEPAPAVEVGFRREEGSEKVVLSLSAKSAPSDTPSTGLKLNPLKPKTNPLKLIANPLKRTNASPAGAPMTGSKRHAPEGTIEQLMFEDQERKRRRMDREAVV